MDRRTDETDVIVEEYEEIIGDLGEFSDQVEIGRRSSARFQSKSPHQAAKKLQELKINTRYEQ